MSSYARYLRSSVPDFVVVLLVACGMVVMVEGGFVCGDALIASPLLLAGEVFFTLVALYLLSYDKRTIVVSFVVLPCVASAALAASSLGWDGVMFEDAEGNPCLALLVCMVATLVVYLLSRRRAGVFALLVLGILVCGYVQFIFKGNHVIAAILFLWGSIALIMLRYHQGTLRMSRTAGGQTVRNWACLCGSALAVLALGLAAYGIVAMADPPTLEPKLLREYIALPEVDMRGIADVTSLDDDEQEGSSDEGLDERYSSQEDDQNDEQTDGGGDSGEGGSSAEQQYQDSFDADAGDAGFATLTYDLPTTVGLLLLIVLLLTAPWFVKLGLRKRWYAKTCALPPQQQVETFYRFFLKRFQRMKMGRAEHLTPLEYARASGDPFDAFVGEDGATFEAVTMAFSQTYYGGKEPTASQVGACRGFYDRFYGNCRHYMGVMRYAFRFFCM